MTTTEAYPRLLGALDDLRRQWRMRTILEGVLLTAAGVFAVLLLTVAADNFLQPEALGRALLALLLWGSLAAGVVTLVVRRVLEDRRDDYFAALVERKHPELHNRLINALQLGRGSQNGFSPGLISAIVGDAATATADLDMASSLDSRPLKRAALCAGVALLLLGGYAVARAPWFGNGLARVAWPFSDTAPYTETQIVEDSIEPGDKKPDDAAADNAALAGLKRWPVNISYFEQGAASNGEQTPVYSIGFELYENGISRALTLDYGDFVVAGVMSQLEMKDAPACK